MFSKQGSVNVESNIRPTDSAEKVFEEGVSFGLLGVHVKQEMEIAFCVRLHHHLTLCTRATNTICLQTVQRNTFSVLEQLKVQSQIKIH